MAVLPAASVAVHVTVVLPTANDEGALLVITGVEQLSVAVAVTNANPVALQLPASALTDTLAGQVMTGRTFSITVTVCVQVLELPFTSVTVQVTVVLPDGKAEGASFVTFATAQLSAVVGVPSATPVALQLPGSVLTLTDAGHVIVGSSLSTTTMV